jgi:hypothetical protein
MYALTVLLVISAGINVTLAYRLWRCAQTPAIEQALAAHLRVPFPPPRHQPSPLLQQFEAQDRGWLMEQDLTLAKRLIAMEQEVVELRTRYGESLRGGRANAALHELHARIDAEKYRQRHYP